MYSESLKIGIALSGGGIRATVFHLGFLKWMVERDLIERIAYISSVSGASLCIGLIYSRNGLKWPSSQRFLSSVLPRIEEVIMGSDIQTSALIRVFPFWLTRKVNLLAKIIKDQWDIQGTMSDLKGTPVWCVNCTTYETGKRFRITQEQIGDYATGYAEQHGFPIADAMAASAGFPFLVGPYKLDRRKYSWNSSEYELRSNHMPHGRYYHLWDGGVYDNLGLEALYKIASNSYGGYLAEGINYIMVSNAGTPSGYKKRIGTSNPKRLLEISMDQVASLRSRSIVSHIKCERNGLFLNIGNSADYILKEAELKLDEKNRIIKESLPVQYANYVRDYNTTLRRPTVSDYYLILRHGYEVAKCTYLTYGRLSATTL